jgi:16S rRNA G1207 methylase RsmC
MGDQIAWEMFQQSLQHLETNGELWVVGNRHLAYHNKLKRLFGNCKTIASNKKFVVLAAQKK